MRLCPPLVRRRGTSRAEGALAGNLQDRYAPNSMCFGCGPKNTKGLRIKSVPSGDGLLAEFVPEPHHVAFADFGSGGIISVLMDCHGNWAATYALMKARGLASPPGTVTAELDVRFLKPSSVRRPWRLYAWATKVEGDRVEVSGELSVDGVVTAKMTGLFIAVREDHPAFHRWQ